MIYGFENVTGASSGHIKRFLRDTIDANHVPRYSGDANHVTRYECLRHGPEEYIDRRGVKSPPRAVPGLLQKEARSSEYRVMESGERARSVTDRR